MKKYLEHIIKKALLAEQDAPAGDAAATTPLETDNAPSDCLVTPTCTPTCDTCSECTDCDDCEETFDSIEDTCEKDPLFDGMSNCFAVKLCGDVKNPQIGVRFLRFTGDCVTTGTCITGNTYSTGYTITEYCTPPIYSRCERQNPSWLDLEHWIQVNVIWERYNYFDDCDLQYRGGLGDITKRVYLESLANNSVSLITTPYTNGHKQPLEIDIVNLNEKWLLDGKFRKGRLKIYVNGKIHHVIEDFEEIIPRALNTDKERQIGVPFNISWGGGTQGLREHLVFSSPAQLNGPYSQDPELFPHSVLSGTTFSGLNTNILIEENFSGTFEGAISQFRMYITPLTAPEVRHNFDLLKDKFMMFDPNCPNCEVLSCEPNDFEYEISGTTATTHTGLYHDYGFGLGRELKFDKRDLNFLIEKKINLPRTLLTEKNWDSDGWWGNQGNTPYCVGFSWAHWIDDGPIKHFGPKPNTDPVLIYKNAQKLDEWVGESYNGTSVRGGAKYLKSVGKISSYLWTFNINTLIQTLLTQGPVVVGTNWYVGMFFPNKDGIIRISGRLAGGHAYVINGVNTKKQLFRIKNSWGRGWGQSGHAYISFSDMQRLMRENGEVCLAVESNF